MFLIVANVHVFPLQMCIQNNPNEARNMLLQNPQLAYALLQAQIVMKIVDPQVALVSCCPHCEVDAMYLCAHLLLSLSLINLC